MQRPFNIASGDFETLCRVVSCRSANKKMTFYVLRDLNQNTLQALLFQKLVIPDESVVHVKGSLVVVEGRIKSNDTTIKSHELHLTDINVVSESFVLPIQISELNHAITENDTTIGHSTRLDNRTVDLRSKQNQAIFRIKSSFVQHMSNFLWDANFIQIHTPKLTSVSSEGGAEVFRTEYFDKRAFLVQSPQLYKQMCINSDFHQVFEIAPVFRAENSRDSRHLCEFTGVDIEMVTSDYRQFLQVVWTMLRHTFFETCRTNSDLIRVANPEFSGIIIPETIVSMSHMCAIDLLRQNGYPEIGTYDDLKNEHEILIGKLVLEKHQSDLVVVEEYPKDLRPFYTMPCPGDSQYSMSYDILFRGQEVLSGSQRQHNYSDLVAAATTRGVNTNAIEFYLASFKYGVFPHAGGGFGLERLVSKFLELSSIQYASLYPRTPNRLAP